MITVAVCTHDRAGLLAETLEHLLEMEVPPSLTWEILVVDNACTDETPQVVERFSTRSGGRVRGMREPRPGLSRARNAAIEAARGEIIAFTDDDVIPDHDWLAELARTFRDHDCAGVGGRVLARWDFEPPKWWTRTSRDLAAAIVAFDPGGGPRPLESAPFGANMAFRQEAFDRYGGFRTDLGRNGEELLSGEDTEFGNRLIRAGEVIRYAPEAVIHHPVSEDRATKSYFRNWYYQYGRTTARRNEFSADCPRILGIPRYLYREIAEELMKMLYRLPSHRRVVHQMKAFRILGTMVECRRSFRRRAIGRRAGQPSGAGARREGARDA